MALAIISKIRKRRQQHENHLPYKAIADEDNGQTVLIVSHGMAIRRVLTAIEDEHLRTTFIGNCDIAKLAYEDGRFTAEQSINVNG